MAARSSMLLVAIAITFFFLGAPPAFAAERPGFRATMTRTQPAINLTRAAHKSRERLAMLAARHANPASVSAQTPLQQDGAGEYAMTFSIGTPPQQLSALSDTGSDLIWAKCSACTQCTPQGSPSYPSYYPDKSSSFSKLPCSSGLCRALESKSFARCGAGGAECDYKYLYGLSNNGHHYTQGYLGSETFLLGSDAVPGIGFGCTNMSEGGYGSGSESGLVGLGNGPLSLVSQLNVGAFSYCLTSDAGKTSPLLLGSGALTGDGVQTTPLLQSSTFYTVNLESISIGAVTTPGTGNNGIVFDSGTTLTFLAEPAYTRAKEALLSQAANLTRVQGPEPEEFEVCFQTTSGAVFPSMVLHFDGADMALKTENYFAAVDKDGSVVCWIVLSSPSETSIVGNIMQMDYHVRYDLEKSQLSFQPANCESF